MRTNAKASTCGVLLPALAALLLVASPARALHRESPPVLRLTSADEHAHPTGRSWGNWFTFSSTQDLAVPPHGPLRAAGRQIFVFNLGYYDCAQDHTKRCADNDTPANCQNTPCPPIGTPYLRQITNGPGEPDNPSISTASFAAVQAGRQEEVWAAFDALGIFGCNPTDAACTGGAAASRRQIFLYNLGTKELRQLTNSALGDSTHPSLNRIGGMVVFESTAPLTGFPNPAGVPQVFVVKLNVVANPQLPGPQFKLLSIGPPPTNTIGLGPSIRPILNENGTGVAFQSRSDLLGGGRDTGVYQIYYVDFDKDAFTGTLHRITNGNAASENPHLGFTKVPNPQPGADNKRKILLFDSAATNLPGAQPNSTGSRIYEVAIAGLSDELGPPIVNNPACSAGRPGSVCVQNITTAAFGNCTHPSVDPSGGRLVFTCDGDPFQNGSTGNQAFALTRQNAQLFQITGAGEVSGAVANSIGQWFITVATTSDLTQGGSCGTQLYVIDFTAGKWVAATGLGQLPPDVIPQGPTSIIGQRNFAILPGGAAAGGSETAVTTRDGQTTSPILTTRKPADQGNISTIIGGPDPFSFEASVEILKNRIKLPPIRTPFGALCMVATGNGTGDVDCDGGRVNGDYTAAKDHFTDDANPDCSQGCRDNLMCTDSYVAPYQYASVCPFCNFDESTVPDTAPPDSGVCTGGPYAGQLCQSDGPCRVNLTCVNDLMSVWACQGRKTVDGSGTFQPGAARINFPVQITASQGAGQDEEFCTADDTPSPMPPIDTLLHLTTGTATGTITDGDPVRDGTTYDALGLHNTGQLTLGTTVTVTETGAPFDCLRLRAGDLAGSSLVGVLPVLNVPNAPGFRDAILSLRYFPQVGALASCDPFCLDAAACDDANPCNGAETCDGNRCAAGTPVVCDDGDACNGAEVCDGTSGSPVCGPGAPLVCDDANTCTTDTCDTATGCTFTADVGEACDDSNACTQDETCQADPNAVATCGGGVPTPVAAACINDGLLCNGVEACNPANGACETTPTTCDDLNGCTADSCDPAGNGGAGACLNPPEPGGTACDDGNACTGPGSTDTCDGSGTCGGAAVVCDDLNACNGLETCDSTLGCVDGEQLVCDDLNVCTDDSCVAATGCVNAPLTGACDDGSACTTGDQCTPNGSSAICTGTLVACDDGNACNGVETCAPGSGCQPGTALTCDDGEVCTTDSCVDPAGCVFAPNTNPCDDGEACTTNDVCGGGSCGGSLTACDDGNACNGVETCDPFNPTTCVDAPDLTCDDQNPCTDDSCDPVSGCANVPNTDGCDDSSACTTGDICSNGECVGVAVQCSDNNACNGVEACDPAVGCVGGSTPDCNDNDECTADSCHPVNGCVNESEPETHALCSLNVLADALIATPADQLGGVRRKRRYVRQVTGAVRALQRALNGAPKQRLQNLRKAQQRLMRLRDGIQKSVNSGAIDDALGDSLLDLIRRAASSLSAAA